MPICFFLQLTPAHPENKKRATATPGQSQLPGTAQISPFQKDGLL